MWCPVPGGSGRPCCRRLTEPPAPAGGAMGWGGICTTTARRSPGGVAGVSPRLRYTARMKRSGRVRWWGKWTCTLLTALLVVTMIGSKWRGVRVKWRRGPDSVLYLFVDGGTISAERINGYTSPIPSSPRSSALSAPSAFIPSARSAHSAPPAEGFLFFCGVVRHPRLVMNSSTSTLLTIPTMVLLSTTTPTWSVSKMRKSSSMRALG